MKKLLLSSLITLSLLTGCDDADKPKAQQDSPKPAQVAQVAKKTVKAPKGEQQATEAEARYRELTAKSLEHIKVILGNYKLLDINLLNVEYNKGVSESTAKTSLEIKLTLDEEKKFILNAEDKVIHNDELADKGILAQVQRVYKIDGAADEISTALNYLEETIDLEANGINKVETKIKPFEYKENEKVLATYQGFTAKTQYEQKELGNPLMAMNSEFSSTPLVIVDSKFSMALEPFSGKYNSDKSTQSFELSPIIFKGGDDKEKIELKIDSVTSNTKNLDFDKEFAFYLGNQTTSLNNITLSATSPKLSLPVAAVIDNIKLYQNTSGSGENYSFKLGFSAEPKTDFLNLIANTPAELKINKLALDIDFDNFPRKAIKLMQEMQTNLDKVEALTADTVAELFSNNIKATISAKLDLASGTVEAQLAAKLKNPVKLTPADLNSKHPPKELMDNLVATLDLAISEAVIEASGQKALFEMYALQYNPKLENGVYKFKVESNGNKLTINGKAMN